MSRVVAWGRRDLGRPFPVQLLLQLRYFRLSVWGFYEYDSGCVYSLLYRIHAMARDNTPIVELSRVNMYTPLAKLKLYVAIKLCYEKILFKPNKPLRPSHQARHLLTYTHASHPHTFPLTRIASCSCSNFICDSWCWYTGVSLTRPFNDGPLGMRSCVP